MLINLRVILLSITFLTFNELCKEEAMHGHLHPSSFCKCTHSSGHLRTPLLVVPMKLSGQHHVGTYI